MFEKIIKFGCGFIVISIVAWICFVVISSVYLSAGLASNHKEDRAPEITMMSAPKGKVEQIGTCKYSGNTIPVIRIIK